MIGKLFAVTPTGVPSTNGAIIVRGIQQGVAAGQITLDDQESILAAAAETPGGSALNTKQLAMCAAFSALGAFAIGYFVARKKR